MTLPWPILLVLAAGVGAILLVYLHVTGRLTRADQADALSDFGDQLVRRRLLPPRLPAHFDAPDHERPPAHGSRVAILGQRE